MNKSTLKGKKIKITHILTNLDMGGVQQVLLNLLLHQDKSLFETEVITLSKSHIYDRGDTAQLFEQTGCPVLNLDMGEKWQASDLGKLGRLVQHLRQTRPDIVQTYHFRSNLYGKVAARLARVPVVVGAEHNLTSTMFESHPRLSLYAWLYRATDWLTDKTLVPSIASEQELVNWIKIPPLKVRHIYNGIVTTRFKEINKAGAALQVRKNLGLAPGTPLVGFVGRLAKPKGIEYLIDAAKILTVQVPEAHFAILGDGPLRQSLEEKVRSLELGGHIHFCGPVTNVPDWVSGFDLLAVPSLAEPFGLVGVEAMASATPVVASRVDGLAELIIPGQTGLLVPPGDSVALAAAIRQILQLAPARRAEMGNAGANLAQNFFDVKVMAAHYQAFYQELC